MKERILSALQKFHSEERGAIILLLLAGFLIVFMTGLLVYDTTRAAQDKMDVQIAADTAAYSQAAVKARSMNMIAYANVAKRTFYAFETMYIAAYLGMIEAQLWYDAECASALIIGNLPACAKAVQGLIYVLSESAELIATNLTTMGAFGSSYADQEVKNLDAYQDYMNDVGPWWGWSENLTRGIRNGATLTSSWPPPPGNLAGLNSLWVQVSQFLDTWLNTNYYQFYPSLGEKDGLPLKQEDGGLYPHFTMCASTATSMEYLWMWGEHYVRSGGFATDSKSIFFGVLSTPLGCLGASMILGDDVLPYELDPTSSYLDGVGDGFTDSAWLQATSNISISYKMDQKRLNSDRTNYDFVDKQYQEGIPLVKGGGGYFAVARSEISYDGGLLSDLGGAIQGNSNVTGDIDSLVGGFRDVLDQPGMWAARWTARMRPMELNGEDSPNFNGMFKDMLPYMLLASPVAFANSPNSFSLGGIQGFGQTALLDLVFLEIASAGMNDDGGMRGFVK